MLTIEELKKLEIGDWIWLISLKEDYIHKAHHGKYYQIQQPLAELARIVVWLARL